MFKGIAGVLIPILLIALVGAGFWGYQENQEKNSILIKAENQYQRAFHDLNYHIDSLHDEIGKALVVNSRRQLSPSLANVWRLSYAAQNDVGQLPLTLMPFNKTEEFLAKIADFSYRVAVRDLDKDPLTDKEYKTLKSLYEHSKDIQHELDQVQTKILQNQLRWMDVEIALAQQDKKADNTIIDGFKTIEKKVQEYPEIDWGPEMTKLEKKEKEKGKNLRGSLITSDQAKQNALRFLGLSVNDQDIRVEPSGKGSNYQVYSVHIEKDPQINLDLTKVGGYVVWMIKNRPVNESRLTTQQALAKAKQFLQKHNYQSMVPIGIDDFDNTNIFTFAYQQNGVIVYPDVVQVKVALDNGEVIGFQSAEYIFNHKERKLPTAKVTKEVARQKVNPNLKILSTRQTLINNTNGDEVLTYEFTTLFDKNHYKIYINALTGEEELVEKMKDGDFLKK
ncbi:spore germination protein [Tepidibacillus fermentans]|uniref:Spore germination protein n=2 Tax=Tepidibacillus fermentans TaxID=1281767 RepID=A0A4R3KKV0_9BACI|nr:spore germination protein [Tepidibacillus fermentans]